MDFVIIQIVCCIISGFGLRWPVHPGQAGPGQAAPVPEDGGDDRGDLGA